MTNDEQIKLELETLLAEYDGVRGEVISFLDGSRQLLNLSLTLFAALIAGAPFIFERALPEFFLVAPLAFYLLAWTQARYALIDDSLTRYLKIILSPRIRKNLVAANPTKQEDLNSIMSREDLWDKMLYNRSLLYAPVLASTYLIPLLAASLSVLAYVGYMLQYKSAEITIIHIGLLIINAALLWYTSYLALRVRSDLGRTVPSQRRTQQNTKS